MPARLHAAKPVMSLIESPPPLPPAPARFVVGCHAVDGRKLAQLGQILLVGEARLELAQTSRQLRRGDKRNGAARKAHATRQRISIQRPPNPWRAVKVERRLVAVVARVGRHARTASSLGVTSSAPVVKCRLKCSSSHAVSNRPITRTCRSGPTALLAKCATTRALCSAAIAPIHHQHDRPTPACGSASARRPPAPRPNTGLSPRRDRRR
jgi:hypothetical protein